MFSRKNNGPAYGHRLFRLAEYRNRLFTPPSYQINTLDLDKTHKTRNHKVHIARLKETRAPEVLTINGRAELVVLDAESYQHLMERFRDMEAIAKTRADFARIRATSPAPDPITQEEAQRRRDALNEIVAETERLGLYK